MFAYAASYFRDPDAQYYLARLYLDGIGAPNDPRAGGALVRPVGAKGQCQAQAMLGAMLFAGDHVPRQAARGLMWLTLAKDSATNVPTRDWINELYDSALRQASEDERALARRLSDALAWKRGAIDSRACGLTARSIVQIDLDRHVVGRLVPAAHMLVDAGIDEAVGRLRRQQQVVDADAVVLLPGAGLIIPERVERRRRRSPRGWRR